LPPSSSARQDRPGLAPSLLAAGMAFFAGVTDVYGLSRTGTLFVSFMSGNTTLLGRALGAGQTGVAVAIAAIVGLFVLGVVLGTVLAVATERRHPTSVLLAVTIALGIALGRPDWATAAMAVAMGMLNAALSRIGAVTVSLTFVTGALVRFGQGIGHLLCGRTGGWLWLMQGAMWLSLLSGAAAGAALLASQGPDELWPLPALAAVLTMASIRVRAG
jgi:uncharacterized membrane protein YoaK (UPF0700 family)